MQSKIFYTVQHRYLHTSCMLYMSFNLKRLSNEGVRGENNKSFLCLQLLNTT